MTNAQPGILASVPGHARFIEVVAAPDTDTGVAIGKSLDAYEAQLRRMTGEEDGITDATFRFSRPISGSYFWCPPVADGKLDLRALGL